MRSRRCVMRNLGAIPVAALVSLLPATPSLAADGDLDLTFGTDGTVVTDLGKGNSPGYALTIDGADYIYVAGAADNGTNLDAFLARFTPNGVLDPTFATAGVAMVNFGKKNDESFHIDQANVVVVQDDGRIVIAGSVLGASDTGGFSAGLARFEPDGSLDSTFGKKGKVVSDALGPILDLALDGGGSLLAVGTTQGKEGTDVGVARFTPKGALDRTFGKKGVLSVDWGAFQEYPTGVIVDDQGRILFAGYGVESTSPLKFRPTIERLDATGRPDTTFGTDGLATLDLADGAKAFELTLHQGMPLIVGAADNPGGTPNDFLLARFADDGTLDPSFGEGGVMTTSAGAATLDMIFSVTQDMAGDLIVAGSSGDGAKDRAAIARYTPDGVIDPTFGGGAIVTTDFAGNAYHADVAIQSGGRIIAGGRTQNLGSAGQPQLATILAQVDLTFGGGAIVTTDFAGNAYHADVAIQSGGGTAGGRTQSVGSVGQPRLAVDVEQAVSLEYTFVDGFAATVPPLIL